MPPTVPPTGPTFAHTPPAPRPGKFAYPLVTWALMFSFIFWPVGLVLSFRSGWKLKKAHAPGMRFAVLALILSLLMATSTIATGYLLVGTVRSNDRAAQWTAQWKKDQDAAKAERVVRVAKADAVIVLVNEAGEAFRAQTGAYPEYADDLDVDTDGVWVDVQVLSPTSWCVQTSDGYDGSERSVTTAAPVPAAGSCPQ